MRAAADVGEARGATRVRRVRLRGDRLGDSVEEGSPTSQPRVVLTREMIRSRRRELRRLHEVVGEDQRLAQAIWVLVGQALAVEAGVRRVNDAVVVRADHHDVPADIRTTSRQILHMVGLGVGDAVVGVEVLAADLAAVLVVRLEAVREVLVAHELLDADRPLGDRVQDGNAVVVVDRRERPLLSESLRDLGGGHGL